MGTEAGVQEDKLANRSLRAMSKDASAGVVAGPTDLLYPSKKVKNAPHDFDICHLSFTAPSYYILQDRQKHNLDQCRGSAQESMQLDMTLTSLTKILVCHTLLSVAVIES